MRFDIDISKSVAEQARTALFSIIDYYESAEGRSPDQYYAEQITHPMAEGKYLLTLSTMLECRLVKDSYISQRAAKVARRLLETSVSSETDALCWGLNFSYKHCGMNEPYLITNAIIAEGLLSCQKYIDSDMLRQALKWLNEYKWNDSANESSHVALPYFSPNTPRGVFNVAAKYAKVLYMQGEYDYARRLSADLIGKWVSPFGWPYERDGRRIDLLHQMYVLDSLWEISPSAELEIKALITINNFLESDHVIDKIEIGTLEEGILLSGRINGSRLAIGSEVAGVVFGTSARLWSLGELLKVTSDFAQEGIHSEYWGRLSRRIASVIMKRLTNQKVEDKELEYFRDLMHVAHGLACFLKYLRGGKVTV